MVCRLLVWCCIFFLKGEKNLACVPLPRGNWFHMTTLVPTSAGRRLKWLPHAPLKCLKGEEKRKKQERRGKTKLSQPQDISTAQCLLGSLYFIPFCTSQTFSEILQRSAACGCLDWMRTTIFGRRAHFRWNMGNICALNAGFCRAYIYIYKHVLHIHQVFSQLMQHRFWNAIRKVTHGYKTRHRRNPIHLKIYKHKASIINQSYKIQYKPLEKIYVTHQTYCSIVIKKQTEERYFPFVLLFFPLLCSL